MTRATHLRDLARLIENELAQCIEFLRFRPLLTKKLRSHWWSSMKQLTSIIGHSDYLLSIPAIKKLREESWKIEDPR